MNHFKTLLLTLTGVSLAQAALAQTPTPFQAQKMAHDLMRLNSGLLHGQQQKYTDVFGRIGSRFEMPEVNSELVRRHEQKFAKESAYLNRTIQRSTPYLHHVATEVERRNMPGEIALLPFIESAFVIKAKSPVGASGLWQFMPATGNDYGLEQTHVYDGRHDVYASTDAALNYLEYLYGLFGDWSLALAAYNWGQGNVSRAIKRAEGQGLLPVYENLNMPQETRNYAPKLLAWRNIVHNPAAFGLQLPHISDEAYFQAIDITTPIDSTVAARLAGISHDEFLRLNPGPNLPVFIPTEKRKLLLPSAAAKTFIRNYQASKAEDLSVYNIYTPKYAEKAEDVAASFGMSLSELRQINGLRNSQLRADLPVLVAKNRAPNISPEMALQTAALEAGASFLQTPVAMRQADVLSKPQAQLTAAQPIKLRGSRTPYGHSTPAASSAPELNFVAATPVMQAQPMVAAVATPQATPVRPAVVQAAVTTTSPAVIPSAPIAYSAPVDIANTAPKTVQVASNQPASSNVLAQAQVRTSRSVVQSDPLINLMNRTGHSQQAKPVVVAANLAAAQTVASNTAAPQVNMVPTAMAAADSATATIGQTNTTPVAEIAMVQTQEVQPDLPRLDVAPIQAPQIDANHAANAVREAIAREDAREAREEAQQAKLRAEAEKRERQLANATEHKVVSGETLYSIARTYDMQVTELLTANGLDGHTIKVGQTLKVGKAADKAIQLAQAKDNSKASKTKATTQNVNYVVRKGDTLVSIAGKFNVQVNDLKKWNNTDSNLQPGQKLKLRQL